MTIEQSNTIAARIVAELRKVRASNVKRHGNVVTFRGGIFRMVTNWNLLVPVRHGVIEVRPGPAAAIEYKFSCVEMLVVVTLMVAIMGVAMPANTPAPFRLGAPLFMWLWLFGMNYLVAAYRLPAFVRRTVDA